MLQKITRPLIAAAIGAAALVILILIPASMRAQNPKPKAVQLIRTIGPGGRLDWSKNNVVTFDAQGTDGYFDVYTMTPQGANRTCLTCNWPGPAAHIGNPTWHPLGRFIAFQAQNPALAFPSNLPSFMMWKYTSPGWGTNNNLWLLNVATGQTTQLTNLAPGLGVLHPKFNSKGTVLIWSEIVSYSGSASQWAMKMATLNLSSTGALSLTNIKTFQPLGTNQFYETHGWSPDDSKIIFSAGDPVSFMLDIYTIDTVTGAVTNLTNSPNTYDEHANYSPDGTKIVWMSNQDITKPSGFVVPYTDYWMMNADGSNKRRLTYFNDPTAPEYYANGITCADLAWAPDGNGFMGKLEINSTNNPYNLPEILAYILP